MLRSVFEERASEERLSKKGSRRKAFEERLPKKGFRRKKEQKTKKITITHKFIFKYLRFFYFKYDLL